MRETRQQFLKRLQPYFCGASSGTIRSRTYLGILVSLTKRGRFYHLVIGGKAIEQSAGQAGAEWSFDLRKRELEALICRLHPERRKPRLVKIGDLRVVQNRKQRTEIDRFLRRRLRELKRSQKMPSLKRLANDFLNRSLEQASRNPFGGNHAGSFTPSGRSD